MKKKDSFHHEPDFWNQQQSSGSQFDRFYFGQGAVRVRDKK